MDCTIVSINISSKKGIRKKSVENAMVLENFGIVNDAHASAETIRQISFLDLKSIEKMRGRGLDISYGDFAENITTAGLILENLHIGSRLLIGGVIEVEITQIGKTCHAGCAIMKLTGECVMPKEGIFGKILKGGAISVGSVIILVN